MWTKHQGSILIRSWDMTISVLSWGDRMGFLPEIMATRDCVWDIVFSPTCRTSATMSIQSCLGGGWDGTGCDGTSRDLPEMPPWVTSHLLLLPPSGYFGSAPTLPVLILVCYGPVDTLVMHEHLFSAVGRHRPIDLIGSSERTTNNQIPPNIDHEFAGQNCFWAWQLFVESKCTEETIKYDFVGETHSSLVSFYST